MNNDSLWIDKMINHCVEIDQPMLCLSHLDELWKRNSNEMLVGYAVELSERYTLTEVNLYWKARKEL